MTLANGGKEVCVMKLALGKKVVLKLGSFNGAKLHRIFLITQSEGNLWRTVLV